jgi:hypothetical protein
MANYSLMTNGTSARFVKYRVKSSLTGDDCCSFGSVLATMRVVELFGNNVRKRS